MRTWSQAFAAQAASDLAAYEWLAKGALPQSHRLHYLQMWLEKLCKAYIHQAKVDALKDTHWRRIGFENPPRSPEIRAICREVDLLHPAAKDDRRRPENVEYPWPGNSGDIEVPAQWKFSLAARLHTDAGRLLLKASDRLTRNPALFIR
jgi:hypothetical protein